MTCLDKNSHCLNVCIFTIHTVYNFSNFVALCTIRGQAIIFKETGSVKNTKVNRRCRVLKEETLDEIGERLEHTLQKSLKHLSQETGIFVSSVQRATTLLKLHIRIVNIHTFTQ